MTNKAILLVLGASVGVGLLHTYVWPKVAKHLDFLVRKRRMVRKTRELQGALEKTFGKENVKFLPIKVVPGPCGPMLVPADKMAEVEGRIRFGDASAIGEYTKMVGEWDGTPGGWEAIVRKLEDSDG